MSISHTPLISLNPLLCKIINVLCNLLAPNGVRYLRMGVDSAWEQKKLEARKMPENAAESHTSGARCVRRRHLFCATFRLSDTLVITDELQRISFWVREV
jgi:hypothetical protein